MSSIQDMNNRMKQNRDLMPSKRPKFKGNNRETIYTELSEEDKLKFKEFSDFQVKKEIEKIRKEFKSKKRLELIILTLFLGVLSAFLIYKIIS